MNRSFFVAHKIIGRTNFIKYIDDDNEIISCQLNHHHFISLKVVILEMDENGQFYNVSEGYKPCLIINHDCLRSFSYNLNCDICHLKEFNNIDCSDILESNLLDIPLGVIEVQPIHYFTNTYDLDLSFELIKRYNESIINEYALITIDNYVDTITGMYEGVRKIKTRIFN